MNIQLHYTLTQDDFYELQVAYRKNRRSLTPKGVPGQALRRFVGWGVIFLALAGVVVIANIDSLLHPAPVAAPARPAEPGGLFVFLPYLILIVIIWLLLIWMRRSRFMYRRAAAQGAKLDVPYVVEITEPRLRIEVPGCVSVMEWTYFIRFVETKSTFLLFILSRSAHILPKRAFASASELEQFRAFAQAHIGNQPIGFPVQPAKVVEGRNTPPAS